MTIQFNCPKCDALIAFDDRHAGKRARCFTCGQLLIIPSKDNEKPKKIKLKIERADPLPGFYRAVFLNSWKLFIDPENATSIVFVIAAVCFKFFLGTGICCVNYASFIIVWGWLLGFYMNIIYETACEIDKLPQIYLGTSFTFLWYIIKPLCIFLWTLAFVEIPFFIILGILQSKGISADSMWQIKTWPSSDIWLLRASFIFGLFLFPMTILTIAVGGDITLLRPSHIIKPVFRSPGPYMITVILLVTAGFVGMQARSFIGANPAIDAANLVFDLATQVIAIIAMRAIGLFYRHYSCHFAW